MNWLKGYNLNLIISSDRLKICVEYDLAVINGKLYDEVRSHLGPALAHDLHITLRKDCRGLL